MAATRANLLEVLTPEAYAHLDRLNDRILAGCEAVIAQAQPARATPSASAPRAA